MKVTYYGHSCFLVEVNGKNLLFDPFITANPLAKEINVSSIVPDYIFISHGHDDHTADAESIARRSGAAIVANYEIYTHFMKKGIEKGHPMNIGGSWNFEFGKVKCVNAIHSSSFADGTYAGNPMGFLIETEDKNFYFAGDTALTYDMKLIGDYKRIDFAMLPIGNNFTMSVENAIIASDFIKCNQIIGMHYDTFGFIKIDHQEAISKFTRAGKQLTLMTIGSTNEF